MITREDATIPNRTLERVFVIGEAGVNHNGSLALAHDLVDAAAAAGVDAVKFQTFRADALTTASARKAAYQAERTGSEGSQFAMLKALELGTDAHHSLADRCNQRGIMFMSTAFDEESLDFLVRDLGVTLLKSASGDLTYGPYLLKLARTGLPVLLSTGMATIEEVRQALAVLAFGYASAEEPKTFAVLDAAYGSKPGHADLLHKVTILHCTSVYPAPPASANLRAMRTMAETFGLRVGYSDHTLGTHITMAAVAMGATVIEKHFTMSRSLPGPDHPASLEPEELKQMVREIREVSGALGDGCKQPAAAELENMLAGRRSLVAARALRAGETLRGALAVKRPGAGISPMQLWRLQHRAANRAYAENEPIDVCMLAQEPGVVT